MTTYIIPENKVEDLREEVFCVRFPSTKDAHKTIEAFGFKPIELEEAKKQAKIGDCLMVEYLDSMLPFQVVDKKKEEDGKLKCIIQSYYLLEKNTDLISKLNPEFARKIKFFDNQRV